VGSGAEGVFLNRTAPAPAPAKESAPLRFWARICLLLNKIASPVALAELFRYLITGGLNAVLTFLVFIAGLYVLHIHYLLALIAAFLAGTVFTYVLNFIWVFRPETDFTFRSRFFKYLLPNVGTFSVNLAALYVLVDFLGGDPFLCQTVLMIVVVATNFLFAKYCAFRR
jgi:putative flippase GtrA